MLILGSLGTLAPSCSSRRTGHAWRLAGARSGSASATSCSPATSSSSRSTLKELADDEATFAGEATVEGKVVTRARNLRLEAGERA